MLPPPSAALLADHQRNRAVNAAAATLLGNVGDGLPTLGNTNRCMALCTYLTQLLGLLATVTNAMVIALGVQQPLRHALVLLGPRRRLRMDEGVMEEAISLAAEDRSATVGSVLRANHIEWSHYDGQKVSDLTCQYQAPRMSWKTALGSMLYILTRRGSGIRKKNRCGT